MLIPIHLLLDLNESRNFESKNNGIPKENTNLTSAKIFCFFDSQEYFSRRYLKLKHQMIFVMYREVIQHAHQRLTSIFQPQTGQYCKRIDYRTTLSNRTSTLSGPEHQLNTAWIWATWFKIFKFISNENQWKFRRNKCSFVSTIIYEYTIISKCKQLGFCINKLIKISILQHNKFGAKMKHFEYECSSKTNVLH